MAEAYQIQGITKQLTEILNSLRQQCEERKWAIDQALTFCQDKVENDPLALAERISAFIVGPIDKAQEQVAEFLSKLV